MIMSRFFYIGLPESGLTEVATHTTDTTDRN